MHPETYLYALMTSQYADMIYLINNEENGGFLVDWANKALTQSWGKANSKSSEDYENQLEKALLSK